MAEVRGRGPDEIQKTEVNPGFRSEDLPTEAMESPFTAADLDPGQTQEELSAVSQEASSGNIEQSESVESSEVGMTEFSEMSAFFVETAHEIKAGFEKGEMTAAEAMEELKHLDSQLQVQAEKVMGDSNLYSSPEGIQIVSAYGEVGEVMDSFIDSVQTDQLEKAVENKGPEVLAEVVTNRIDTGPVQLEVDETELQRQIQEFVAQYESQSLQEIAQKVEAAHELKDAALIFLKDMGYDIVQTKEFLDTKGVRRMLEGAMEKYFNRPVLVASIREGLNEDHAALIENLGNTRYAKDGQPLLPEETVARILDGKPNSKDITNLLWAVDGGLSGNIEAANTEMDQTIDNMPANRQFLEELAEKKLRKLGS